MMNLFGISSVCIICGMMALLKGLKEKATGVVVWYVIKINTTKMKS